MKQTSHTRNSTVAAPRVSVAMATYNGATFLREQLDSIARQTRLPVEIVITDDGSTDNTLQVIDDFSRTAPFPVRVFPNQSSLGYADNFFRAASLCTGDVIAFCDQDDIWLENKLETCSKYFSDSTVQLVIHSAQTLTPEGNHGHKYPEFSKTEALAAGKCDSLANHPGFAMVIRKELLQLADSNHRPPRLYSHDHWLWLLAASIGAIVTIAESLVFYRQHRANIFGAPPSPSTPWQPERSAGSSDYLAMAESEIACSHFLVTVAEQRPDLAEKLTASAERLRCRSEFHQLRSRIYAPESGFLRRAASFGQVALLGGYFPDPSRTRLGPRAAMKDLVFGVPGLFRIITAHRSATRD